ncbi:sialate O-acetylesterase [Tundrisphaera lichenicola]|uniref:sialate O-acetylesterase n=1 Tax=Tundrisphaera lichenicola TaxID=2029860 RepID=UPI003EB7A3A8
MNKLRWLAILSGVSFVFLALGPVGTDGGPQKRQKARKAPATPASISFPVGSITAITEPMIRQVVQRRDDNRGNIVFMGKIAGNVDGFQARSTLRAGMSGMAQGWASLESVSISGTHFVGVYRQMAGGFYDLEIRPTYRNQVGASSTVFAVGVGEVFLTAGQSNSTNAGPAYGFVPDLRVSSFVDGTGHGTDPAYPNAGWRWGIDPQPTLDGTFGSSVWPRMASNLAAALNVPVGLYSLGYYSTSIDQWQPGATITTPTNSQASLFVRLIHAVNYFKYRSGVRAVLWDQGESDTALKTNPVVYEARLRALIDLSRQLTGVPVKWMVATATGPPGTDPSYQPLLEQAQANVVDESATFTGPDTDRLGYEYRQSPPNGFPYHFNVEGVRRLGDLWGIYIYNWPGFLAPGELPPH